MWKQLYDLYTWAKQLLLFGQETQRSRTDIKELQNQMEELTATVQALTYEVRRRREVEMYEREKLMLQVENAMLKFERQMRLGKAHEKEEDQRP